MRKTPLLLIVVVLAGLQSLAAGPKLFVEMIALPPTKETLRIGYAFEKPEAPFRGCVLYLEGFADSALNHLPLFSKLSENGYRILFFDYMGQGGSAGFMNRTRFESKSEGEGHDVFVQAKAVWDRYSFQSDSVSKRTCADSKKMLVGWSVGGLVAYKLAADSWASATVLIAPQIASKFLVGEMPKDPAKMQFLKANITEKTLSRNRFAGEKNPHLDPPKPRSPNVVPLFSAELVKTADRAAEWKVPAGIAGLAFLSGTGDVYVDRDKTESVLKKNAAHFEIVKYDGALHELDNEQDSVANDLAQRTVEFLNRVSGK